ncbi:uncharacterized protein CLAFUR5_04167 [Fulvia fulva]|uniref:Uncharacterized protein n=1 Tax=Passalora fulva TaxID=5499 RepID=A0A9Q8P860_PASFU|nr:uncharacterized protein CLAFUR5_04167 [Fulvia fulva]KAK4628064.1 hypothetical protein CLAFUR0_04190 [Fulvia fulva]UJO16814.1 hypothetical protein CLAFUR5_04167 [Fulvia fulva]
MADPSASPEPARKSLKQMTLSETIEKNSTMPPELWTSVLELAFTYNRLINICGARGLIWLIAQVERVFDAQEPYKTMQDEAVNALLANNIFTYRTTVIESNPGRRGVMIRPSAPSWTSEEVELLSKIKRLHIRVESKAYIPPQTTRFRQPGVWHFKGKEIIRRLLSICGALESVIVCFDLTYVGEQAVRRGVFPVREVLDTVFENTAAHRGFVTSSDRYTLWLEDKGGWRCGARPTSIADVERFLRREWPNDKMVLKVEIPAREGETRDRTDD